MLVTQSVQIKFKMDTKSLSMFWCLLAIATSFQCYIHTQISSELNLSLSDSFRWGALHWLPWLAITPALLKHINKLTSRPTLSQHELKLGLITGCLWGSFIGVVLSIDVLIQEGSTSNWLGIIHSNVLREIPLAILTLATLFVAKRYFNQSKSEPKSQTKDLSLPVPITQISHINSCGNYVEIFDFNGEKHLIRNTMKSIECQLTGTQLVRIHRSCIVNLTSITEMHRTKHGDLKITLTNDATVIASRSYVANIKHRLPSDKIV